MDIYIQQGENRQGPYTLEQVHEYYEQKIFKANDMAWNTREPDWMRLVTFIRIYPKPAPPRRPRTRWRTRLPPASPGPARG